MKFSMIRVLQNLDTVVVDYLIEFHLLLILVTCNKEQVANMCRELIGTFPAAASNRMLPNDDSKTTQFSKAHSKGIHLESAISLKVLSYTKQEDV